MYFISIQPDADYYIWQLDVFLFRMGHLGLEKSNIHVIFGCNVNTCLSTLAQKFIQNNIEKASFFYYVDERTSKEYASSLRPHIMAKHLNAFPELEQATYYYHDADLLFRELPDIDFLRKGDTWYVGDTKSYLGYEYLRRYLSVDKLIEMAQIVGLAETDIQANDAEVGGAQYVLKNTPVSFWKKVERDCEKMYLFLNQYNGK